jgi:hypothetical protein
MRLSISKYLVFLVFVFFPFISFGTNSLDTQPWIIILSLFLARDIFYTYRNVAILVILLTAIFFSAFVGFLFSFDSNLFYFIRGVSGYLIFIIVYLYQSQKLTSSLYKYENHIFIFNLVYLFAGIVQTIYSPYFFQFLANVRTSETRGVTSLTPEPTMFGIVLLFFCLFYLVILTKRNKRKIIFLSILNCIFIVFVAKSTTVSLYLFLALIIWLLLYLRIKYVIFLSLILTFLVNFRGILSSLLLDSRLYNISNFLNEVKFLNLLAKDKSVQDRLLANIFPFKASFDNFFIPGGFTLESSLNSIDIQIFDLTFYDFHTGSIVMSLWGSLIAQLGFILILFSIFLLLKYSRIVYSVYSGNRRKIIFIVLMLFFLGFTSINISFPFIPFLLASLPLLKSREVIN